MSDSSEENKNEEQQPETETPPTEDRSQRPEPTETERLTELGHKRAIGHVLTMVLPFIGLALVIGFFSIYQVLGGRGILEELFGKPMSYPKGFLSLLNVTTVIKQTVIVAIAAMGMTFVIISAGIDLSVGSIIALTTVTIAMALDAGGEAPSVLYGLLAGVGIAVLAGFLNGAMITVLRIVPFIATLGMLGIARGVAKWFTAEQTVFPEATWLNDLSPVVPKEEWLAVEPAWVQSLPDNVRTSLEQIVFSPSIWILLVVVVGMWFLLNYTTFGRYTMAIGSNEATARLCGVRTSLVKLWVYSLAGFMAGLAGVIQFSRLSGGDPTVAVGLELDVIAAVVIGGGSLSGGQGSIVGTLIGALAMSFLRNGCTLVGWGNYVQEIFIGIFIVLFVAIDQLRRARTAT